jgi:hypothetical protein
MLKRHELEVDELYPRPNHPVFLYGGTIGALQLFLGRGSFHYGHGGEEAKEVNWGEDELVDCDASNGCGRGFRIAVYNDAFLKEFEPGRCCGAEDC